MSLSKHMLGVYELFETVLDVAFCVAEFIFSSVNRDLALHMKVFKPILCLNDHLFACEDLRDVSEPVWSLYIIQHVRIPTEKNILNQIRRPRDESWHLTPVFLKTKSSLLTVCIELIIQI